MTLLGFNATRYWKREFERLGWLARVARVLFAIAAVCTSCEQRFSLS
jgi:hypothetical protein